MPEYEMPPIETIDVTAVLFALSDPARLAIVRQLDAPIDGTGAVTCQSVGVDMPKSTRSHHLKVLREAGVTRMEPRGRESVLTLRREELESRWPGLLGAVLAENRHRAEV